MITQDNLLRFINSHRSNLIEGCNFFYKSLDGKYIDANTRTAYIAGVEAKMIKGKRDVDLQWSLYSDLYQKSDQLALCQSQAIFKLEEGINLRHQHVPTLSLKQAVIGDCDKPLGVFGAVLYVEEMDFMELSETLHYINTSLSIISKVSANQLLTQISANPISEKLTQREKDCARYLCLGMNAREIGMHLNLSKRTIESYLANMKDKLLVSSKSELIMKLLDGTHL